MDKSKEAVIKVIKRMIDDPRVAYLIGPGSGTYDSLISAYSEIEGITEKESMDKIEPLLRYEK